jgi:type I restriction enzyme, R subunit
LLSEETEADTRANRIDPVLGEAGWGVVEGSRVRREVICPGRIQTGGRRGKGLSCDYVLEYRGQKLAVLEAKRASKSHRDGVGQAKDYAERLGSRFAFATNGIEWRQMDLHEGVEADFQPPFPTPQELWDRTFAYDNAWRKRFGEVPFEDAGGKWSPRYYQHKAITAALEAIAKGEERILLTLATGTGKTSIAFQIAWKLFQAKWNLTAEPTRRPRILFLADRNILADQAYNAFSAFPPDAIARIDPATVRKHGGAPKNASVFFTIFQTFMTGEEETLYQAYPSDFFDLIIIDECHRGGAKDESEWRAILEYFKPAVQLGLTATPKRKHNADTYAYFGDPVYTYALKDGIEDGFLTPFKVRQMASTIDEYVYNPADDVLQGQVEEGQKFNESDFNRVIEIEGREKSRIKEFMANTNQNQKTLVFCATQRHAAIIRDLINEISDSSNPNYCHRVTAEDGAVGEQHLRDFQDNDKTIPTILTTSQKLSTGVDARNVRHIVLMRPITSMIEFKQIIGRGTRTYEGKDFFTIWDFVKAHENFQDPEWDGEPIAPEPSMPSPLQPSVIGSGGSVDTPPQPETAQPPREIIKVQLSDGTERRIRYLRSTSYWDASGTPMSAMDLMKKLFGDLAAVVPDEDTLRRTWSDPDKRSEFLNKLEEAGYDAERLGDIRLLIDAPDSDLFDVLAYVLFEYEPLTRSTRANAVRTANLDAYKDEVRSFLLHILNAYEQEGEGELATVKLRSFIEARYGSMSAAKEQLGDIGFAKQIFRDIQASLYRL